VTPRSQLPAPPAGQLPQHPATQGQAVIPAPTMDALGIVLSYYLARGTTHAYAFGRLLRLYAHTPVTIGGVEIPAPWPAVDPELRVPSREPCSSEEFRDIWAEHLDVHGTDLPLPLADLQQYVPAPLWPVLAAVITDGPQVAAARMERVMRAEARRPVRTDRRHLEAEGPRTMGSATLTAYRVAGNRIFAVLCDLRTRSPFLGPHLPQWAGAAPKLSVAAPTGPQTDTTAPTRVLVRAAWQEAEAMVAAKLGPAGADELATIAALPDYRMKGLFRPTRRRATLMLMAVVGARPGALLRLDQRDYVPAHRWEDGTSGPALALRPAKSQPRAHISWKPLPAGAAAVLDVYLAVVARRLGRPLAAREPLLIGRVSCCSRWIGLEQNVGGTSHPSAIKAWIPRGDDPHYGYTPHSFRSYAAQAVRSLDGHDWLVRQRVDASPHWVAEALLDHKLAGLDALYGGASKDRDRARLSGYGIRLGWDLLTTDAGARRDYDAEAYRRALGAAAALRSELQRIGEEIDRAHTAKPAPAGADPHLALLEEMMRAHVLVRRERQTYEQLTEVGLELERLEHDPARRIVVADTATWTPVDLAVLRTELAAGDVVAIDAPRPRVRLWLSVQELRQVADVAPATVPRWLGQGERPPKLPFPDGDPRNPWTTDRVPVDESLGQRARRILVEGLSETWLRADAGRAARLEEILATPTPDGWSAEHAAAELQRPEWLL
jgi:hypothetical protein